MSPNLIFWFYVYALTVTALIIAFTGVARIRKGDAIGHSKRMNLAIYLILFFVASYVVKLLVLGREDKSNWESWHFLVLYVHEFFIACMLISGSYTRYLAAKFKHTIEAAAPLNDLDAKRRRRHRLTGKICLGATSMAIVTASMILYIIGTRS